MVAIHGASPSGRLLVVGREADPLLVPGRLGGEAAEAFRGLGWVFWVLTFRAPAAVALPGVFAFLGDGCADLGGEPLPDEDILREIP